MSTLNELIKDCDTELQVEILRASVKKGEEFKITYVKNNKAITSTIFFPFKLNEKDRYTFLNKVYGYDFELEKISFEDFTLDEQRKRVRALKIICGKFNDLWIK